MAAVLPPNTLEAVAVLPSATLVVPQPTPEVGVTVRVNVDVATKAVFVRVTVDVGTKAVFVRVRVAVSGKDVPGVFVLVSVLVMVLVGATPP